jgi:hypothetical protein
LSGTQLSASPMTFSRTFNQPIDGQPSDTLSFVFSGPGASSTPWTLQVTGNPSVFESTGLPTTGTGSVTLIVHYNTQLAPGTYTTNFVLSTTNTTNLTASVVAHVTVIGLGALVIIPLDTVFAVTGITAVRYTAQMPNAPSDLGYYWDFGDGMRATGQTVTHVFATDPASGATSQHVTLSVHTPTGPILSTVTYNQPAMLFDGVWTLYDNSTTIHSPLETLNIPARNGTSIIGTNTVSGTINRDFTATISRAGSSGPYLISYTRWENAAHTITSECAELTIDPSVSTTMMSGNKVDCATRTVPGAAMMWKRN